MTFELSLGKSEDINAANKTQHTRSENVFGIALKLWNPDN